MSGQKRAGASLSTRAKKLPRSIGQELVPHYSPEQMSQLMNMIDPERSANSIDSAAKAFATLGKQYKEAFISFCAKDLDFDRDDAEDDWNIAIEDRSLGSIAAATQELLGWAHEDNRDSFRTWLHGCIPQNALQKYREGDRGLAEIAGGLLRETIKASARSGKRIFYRYNSSDAVWSQTPDATVKMLISHAVEGVLLKILDSLGFAENFRMIDDGGSADDDDKVDPDEEKMFVKSLIDQVRNIGKMNSILSLAQDGLLDEDFVARLDSASHLLGVQNGVIDLRTGELRPRTAEDMISTVLSVRYDPQTDDGWITKVISDIMANDDEMVVFLQKLLGYCITGETSEDIFIVFTNAGSNGKDVIIGGLQALCRTFFRQMETDLIVGKCGPRIQTKLKKGLGGRIWSFSETDEKGNFNSDAVKMLSGGNRLGFGADSSASYQKCILTTNHIPQLGFVDDAMMRRMLIVKFPVTFRAFKIDEDETQFERRLDPNMRTAFTQHDQALLKWIVDGAKAWYAQKGLVASAPLAVKKAREDYFESQDVMAQFLIAECEEGKGFFVLTSDLLEAYNRVFKCDKINFPELNRRMKGRPFPKKQVPSAGNRQAYHGIRLKKVARSTVAV